MSNISTQDLQNLIALEVVKYDSNADNSQALALCILQILKANKAFEIRTEQEIKNVVVNDYNGIALLVHEYDENLTVVALKQANLANLLAAETERSKRLKYEAIKQRLEAFSSEIKLSTKELNEIAKKL